MVVTQAAATPASTDLSYAGGHLSIAQTGINPEAYITIGGLKGKYLKEDGGNTIFEVPAIVHADTVTDYPELITKGKITDFTVINDANGQDAFYVADGSIENNVYTSTSADGETCYIGIEMNNGLAKIEKIRFMANRDWPIVGMKMTGAVFEAAGNDGVYTTLKTLNEQTHTSWNSFYPDESLAAFKTIRLRHNMANGCELVELEVYGTVYADVAAIADKENFQPDVMFYDLSSTTATATWSGAVTFKTSTTPVVTTSRHTTDDVSYGEVFGGYTITLTGTNLNLGNEEIIIDG